jgi:hypothetical protein
MKWDFKYKPNDEFILTMAILLGFAAVGISITSTCIMLVLQGEIGIECFVLLAPLPGGIIVYEVVVLWNKRKCHSKNGSK